MFLMFGATVCEPCCSLQLKMQSALSTYIDRTKEKKPSPQFFLPPTAALYIHAQLMYVMAQVQGEQQLWTTAVNELTCVTYIIATYMYCFVFLIFFINMYVCNMSRATQEASRAPQSAYVLKLCRGAQWAHAQQKYPRNAVGRQLALQCCDFVMFGGAL